MPKQITNWIKGHLSSNKIDYMSLNRLRQNQTVSSTIPVRLCYTEKTRRADNLIWVRSHDTSMSFETMDLIRNPYGVTPLTALAVFHTDTPCRLSYTIHCEDSREDFCYDFEELTTSHVAPIWGLYANANNEIELTLYREDGTIAGTRKLEWQTEAIPTDYSYPMIVDKAGNVRYILTIPTRNGELYPLSDSHFLLINDKMRTRTGSEPLPTHIHEIDLLGRNYRTCFVGNGILDIYATADEQGNLLVVIPGTNTPVLAAIDRETGTLLRTIKEWDNCYATHAMALQMKDLLANTADSLEQFVKAGEELDNIEFANTGWLRPPVFYKAASVESTGAISLEEMQEKYHLTFAIVGANLSIDTTNDDIQEIVFSRADRLYQLDLTNPPLTDEQYKTYHYTLAVPFTEMYSGTYSIVIRFRDGGQAILKDTVTLSRQRSN